MNSIDRAHVWFWNSVAGSTRPSREGSAVLRIAAALFALVLAVRGSTWVQDTPPALFHPPRFSVLGVFSTFPPAAVTVFLDGSAALLGVLVCVGVHARLTSILFALVNIASRNITYSFGKIDHDSLLWLFFICLAFSGWGQRLALIPDRPNRFDSPTRCVALLGVALGFAMSAAGVHKALGWLDFDPNTSGVLRWLYSGYVQNDRRPLLGSILSSVPPWGLEAMDYAATAFEVSCFVALLCGPVLWRIWLLVGCCFHFANCLFLGISFAANMPVYFAFVSFGHFESIIRRHVAGSAVTTTLVLLTGAVLLLVARWLVVPDLILETSALLWLVGVVLMSFEVARVLRGETANAVDVR